VNSTLMFGSFQEQFVMTVGASRKRDVTQHVAMSATRPSRLVREARFA